MDWDFSFEELVDELDDRDIDYIDWTMDDEEIERRLGWA